MSGPPRVNVVGLGVSPVNMDMALEQIDAWIARGERQYVCVCSVNNVMQGQRSERLRRVMNASGMNTPDGMPLVWISRLSGHPKVSRVYGPDLMLAEMARSVARGYRHFFYGGGEGIATRLAERMRQRFPGVTIAGTFSPLFAAVEQLCTDEAAETINQAKPDIVWVGISTPKQELWMGCMRPKLEAAVLIGVGAAFDFHAGQLAQAPSWMQRTGLEWLFRLVHEPRRLWRRYLLNNPRFVYELARQKLGLRRYELS